MNVLFLSAGMLETLVAPTTGFSFSLFFFALSKASWETRRMMRCDAVILYLTGFWMPTMWPVKRTMLIALFQYARSSLHIREYLVLLDILSNGSFVFVVTLSLSSFATSHSMFALSWFFIYFSSLCVRCNLFNLIHNLFVFIVMFNLNWCSISFYLFLSLWHWHKMLCHNKIAMNIFILFGISTTTQTTM